MHCPTCQAIDTKVIESRVLTNGNTVRRRRKCEMCQKRFTTYEKIELQMPFIIKSSDGRREAYNRQKITRGIEKACQKRPISTSQIENVVSNIEKEIINCQEKEILAEYIGELTMKELYKLDSVAYVRFASCYWKFEEINEFVNGLKVNSKKHIVDTSQINKQ